MKDSENINRLFDEELSVEEKEILLQAMEADPELANEFQSIQSFAAMHTASMPAPKDEVFIEREFLEIQKQITASVESDASAQQEPESASSKVVFFPGSTWFRSVVAIAAAITLTVTGAWIWNQNANDASGMNDDSVAFVETDIAGASSMIFMDEKSGWTFVWVDEPADSTEVSG